MKATRGRPKTSSLNRAEQLRAAKRAQRERERAAGVVGVELRVPKAQAKRLRIAANTPAFAKALEEFLDEVIVDLQRWPTLRELAWNRKDRWIPADEALALYERNWRFVETEQLSADETALIDRLKARYGGGLLHV